MADDILNQIKNDPKFYQDISKEFKNIKEMQLVNKAALSEKLFVNYKKVEKAMEIAGETIYDLSLENDELISKLEEVGTYDKEIINKAVKFRKLNSNNDDKNKVIRERL